MHFVYFRTLLLAAVINLVDFCNRIPNVYWMINLIYVLKDTHTHTGTHTRSLDTLTRTYGNPLWNEIFVK